MDNVKSFGTRAVPSAAHTALVIRNVTAAFSAHSWTLDSAMRKVREAATPEERYSAEAEVRDALQQAERFMDKNLRTRPEIVTNGD